MSTRCEHDTVACLSQYELIRKYRCARCSAVMMCSCDEAHARRFYPHQLAAGVDFKTKMRVPVTNGFQPRICNTCRGLPELAAPKAPLRGSTSKARRYYWREIAFETARRLAGAVMDDGERDRPDSESHRRDLRKRIEAEVAREFAELHRAKPKYKYADESTETLLRELDIPIERLDATYKKGGNRAVIVEDGRELSVEEFVSGCLSKKGFNVMALESRPFHAIFATFMWLLVQDPGDSNVRIVMFGRPRRDNPSQVDTVWTHHPIDFGSEGYGTRRRDSIERHFSEMLGPSTDLVWLFDYWQEPSSSLRAYLDADTDDVVARARQLVQVLPREATLSILRFLIENYWGRYLGWPDLLAWRDREYSLLEVKSSTDSIRPNQAAWMRANTERLHLPFRLIKVHRGRTIQ